MRSGGVTQTTLNYTGQRKDDTGLLYYHARYYDPSLGRFVSPDSIVPGATSGKGGAGGTKGAWQNTLLTVDFHESSFASSISDENDLVLSEGFWSRKLNREGPSNPQALNRFSYTLNNPLRYIDPTGHNADTCLGCPPSRDDWGPGGSSSGSWDPGADGCSGQEFLDQKCGPDDPMSNDGYGFGGGVPGGIGKNRAGGMNVPIKIKPKLTQGNKKMGLEHIVYNHWHSSGAKNKSKFSKDVKLKELKSMIDEVGNDPGPWRQEGNSFVKEYDTRRVIGVDQSGRPTTRVRVVCSPSGEVISAYPVP